MTELAYTMKLFDGIKELLMQLQSKGIRLGIITSKNRKELQNDFPPFGIHFFFDTIITVENSFAPKQSPEPMLANLNKA